MTCGRLTTHPCLAVSFSSCEGVAAQAGRRIRLDDRRLHVWGIDLEASPATYETCLRWLDNQERSRCSRFLQEQDRQRYTLAHGCLRVLLSRYAGCGPESIRFRHEAGGKPLLVLDKAVEPITFSMAHSHNRLLVAIAKEQAIGVDLERIRDTADTVRLAGRFYRRSEKARLEALPPEERTRQFFRYWVAKEAVLKGKGVGLSALQDCEVVATDSNERASVTLTPQDPPWAVQWLSCGGRWEGAVAFQDDMTVQILAEE